jgi:hypothetical protein
MKIKRIEFAGEITDGNNDNIDVLVENASTIGVEMNQEKTAL